MTERKNRQSRRRNILIAQYNALTILRKYIEPLSEWEQRIELCMDATEKERDNFYQRWSELRGKDYAEGLKIIIEKNYL